MIYRICICYYHRYIKFERAQRLKTDQYLNADYYIILNYTYVILIFLTKYF